MRYDLMKVVVLLDEEDVEKSIMEILEKWNQEQPDLVIVQNDKVKAVIRTVAINRTTERGYVNVWRLDKNEVITYLFGHPNIPKCETYELIPVKISV